MTRRRPEPWTPQPRPFAPGSAVMVDGDPVPWTTEKVYINGDRSRPWRAMISRTVNGKFEIETHDAGALEPVAARVEAA